ncbi:MAG: aldo/keto reductase [Planctomycetota bacterium]|nr:aldo/keto reductase [Planctomycetota bacterium]
MKTRQFHSDHSQVSEIGIGTWQIGVAEWGEVSDQQAIDTLNVAADSGVTLIDTADIYGTGRSEQLIGRFLAEQKNSDRFTVITKFGRGSSPGWPDNFQLAFTRPLDRRWFHQAWLRVPRSFSYCLRIAKTRVSQKLPIPRLVFQILSTP